MKVATTNGGIELKDLSGVNSYSVAVIIAIDALKRKTGRGIGLLRSR